MLAMTKVGRPRIFATNAERQAHYRRKKRAAVLDQIPVVCGEGYSLYSGDAVTLVPLIGPYDHCITDPPYEADAHTRMRRTRAVLEGRQVNAGVDFAPVTEVQRRLLAQLRCQWILIFCQAEAIARYQALLGAKYKRALVWDKPDSSPQFTGDRPAMGYESLVCAWGQPGRSHWNAGGKRSVYRHGIRDVDVRLHPTQKPLPLMRELVRDFTQPGDVVLDPFMGSGSTGVACIEEGRRFVGIEWDARYFRLACERLAATARQGQLFPVPDRRQQMALLPALSRTPSDPLGPGLSTCANLLIIKEIFTNSQIRYHCHFSDELLRPFKSA
jgi:site-specific DNA-methyltransferase (adenine-specific)